MANPDSHNADNTSVTPLSDEVLEHFDEVKFDVNKGAAVWEEYYKIKPKSDSIETINNNNEFKKHGIRFQMDGVYGVHKYCGTITSRNGARLSNHVKECDKTPSSLKNMYDKKGHIISKNSHLNNISSNNDCNKTSSGRPTASKLRYTNTLL